MTVIATTNRRDADRLASTASFAAISTPLGEFRLYEMPDGSLRTTWKSDSMHEPAFEAARRDPDLRPGIMRDLHRYFASAGDAAFRDAETPRGPDFFRRCWEACRTIPRGEVRSYGWLAQAAGSGPESARAAGQAMRRNPMPVIIPCHRVIASDGRLHGFAGQMSGAQINLKRRLQELEGRLFQAPLP